MEKRIAERTTGEGVGVEQVGRDKYRVTLNVTPWTVDLAELSCKCPNFQEGHNPACKHIVTADAVAAIPAGPGASVAIERIVDLCRRIYAKNLTLDQSYATLTDAMYSRHATQAMRSAAIKRHGVRLARQVA